MNGVEAERRIDFTFRETPEDFRVEEVDAFEPDGHGDHLLVRVEHRGLGTVRAARRLARALDLPSRDVTFAGRKDVHSVSVQRFAVLGGSEERLAGAEADDLRILESARHSSALRQGAHAGNRFVLRLGDLQGEDLPLLEQRLGALAARGMPNAFGEQRYGRGGSTAELGRLLAKGEPLDYIELLARTTDERHRDAALELARRARGGTSGERRRATELARHLDRDLAAVARQLARRRDDPAGLVRALPKPLRALHLSALQSRVFDRVLAARVALGTFDVPREGDVLLRPGRGPFVLRRPTDAGLVAAAAVHALEVTGPIVSPRAIAAEGEALVREREALAAEGLTLDDFDRPGGLAPRGSRRALRARLLETRVGTDSEGGRHAIAEFRLPPGAYATTLLAHLRGAAE